MRTKGGTHGELPFLRFDIFCGSRRDPSHSQDRLFLLSQVRCWPAILVTALRYGTAVRRGRASSVVQYTSIYRSSGSPGAADRSHMASALAVSPVLRLVDETSQGVSPAGGSRTSQRCWQRGSERRAELSRHSTPRGLPHSERRRRRSCRLLRPAPSRHAAEQDGRHHAAVPAEVTRRLRRESRRSLRARS